jgi:glucose dehydrogenase
MTDSETVAMEDRQVPPPAAAVRGPSTSPPGVVWSLMIALHAAALALGACGTSDNPGRNAALAATARPGRSAAGDVALPAVADRGASWLPPGAGDGDWLMPSRDYGGTRYSPLAEITAANAAQLQLAWTFDDGESHYGHEMTPLVANNTMYIVSPFPNRAFAIDLTKTGGTL